MNRCIPIAASLGLWVVATGLGIALLPWHGLTWDLAAGDFLYGERMLAFLLSGDVAQLDLERVTPPLASKLSHPDFRASLAVQAHELFPFADLLSAISCLILSRLSGLMGAIEAHLVPVPVFAVTLAVFLQRWIAPRWGAGAAGLTAAFLLLNPRFAGEALVNLKDVPETCLFGCCLLWAARANTRPAVRLVGAAVLAGLALASKPNALFLPFVLLPYALLRGDFRRWRHAATALVVFPMLMAVTAFSVWPWLWPSPLERGSRVVEYVVGKQSAHAWCFDALQNLATMMPEPVLLLVPFGLVAALRRRGQRADGVLLLLWILVPLVRHVVLGVPCFDGVRHYLEVLPPLMALAGLGGAMILQWLPRPRLVPMTAALVAFLAPLAVGLVRHFPLWTTYYNAVSGGLVAAREREPDVATDYWADTYRVAFARLNASAPPGSRLAIPVAGHIAFAVRGQWLRPDITPVWPTDLVLGAASAPACVLFIDRPEMFDALAWFCERRLQPTDVIAVAGVPVCRTFVFDPGERAAVGRLGDNWRAAAAWLDREAPRHSIVITDGLEFRPPAGGGVRFDLVCLPLYVVPRISLRGVDPVLRTMVFGVVPAVVPGAPDVLAGMGFTRNVRLGDGDEAVEIWRP